jgi:hypothetical protein
VAAGRAPRLRGPFHGGGLQQERVRMLALLPHRAAGRAVHARQPAAQLAQLPVGEVRAGSVCLRQCGAQLLLGGLPGSVNALGSLDWLLSS